MQALEDPRILSTFFLFIGVLFAVFDVFGQYKTWKATIAWGSIGLAVMVLAIGFAPTQYVFVPSFEKQVAIWGHFWVLNKVNVFELIGLLAFATQFLCAARFFVTWIDPKVAKKDKKFHATMWGLGAVASLVSLFVSNWFAGNPYAWYVLLPVR